MRWLVVEPSESSDVAPLAAVRFQVDDATRVVLVDIMAVGEAFQGKGLGSWTLRRVERMAMEMSMVEVVIEIAKCRHDLISWLEKRCYQQIGGYLSEALRHPTDNGPVTILQFQVCTFSPTEEVKTQVSQNKTWSKLKL